MSSNAPAPPIEPVLRRTLEESLNNSYEDNHILYYSHGLRRVRYLDRIGLAGFTPDKRREKLAQLEENILAMIEAMAPLFERLADEPSRQTLILAAAYRLLGYRHVKFPYYCDDAIEQREMLAARTRMPDPPDMEADLLRLRAEWFTDDLALYNLYPAGKNLMLYSTAETLYMEYFQPAYHYETSSARVAVEPGDLVIDCGAGLGDQDLFFAERAGENGLIVCLEPHPANSAICRKNRQLNPRLAKRLRLYSVGAWDEDRVSMAISLNGASSCLRTGDTPEAGAKASAITCRTVDSLIRDLPRKDLSFLKMDIEGAEPNALRGSAESIARCRPRMGLSIYHNLSDFREIPAFIDAVAPGYRFYLKHHSINIADTILYALP